MKRLVLIIAIISSINQISSAQEIGIRLGNVYSGYLSLDLVWDFNAGNTQTEDASETLTKIQEALKPKRIHADLTYFNETFIADAICDFLYAPVLYENLYYYAGPGILIYSGNDGFGFGISAEAGLEYRFDNVPLALGTDWKPCLIITDGPAINFFRLGINLRYVF